MTDHELRIRELMKQAGHEHSMSLYQAFKQFEQELLMEFKQKQCPVFAITNHILGYQPLSSQTQPKAPPKNP